MNEIVAGVLVDTDGAKRATIEQEILLGLLDAVERDRNVTQRRVAAELGIALGLANAYLKRCVRKGLIKVSEVPRRRYAYYLTPQGLTEKSRLTALYLSYSFNFFRNARAQIEAILSDAVGRAHVPLTLVGEGDLAEIAILVARQRGIEVAGIVQASDAHSANVATAKGVVITDLVDPRASYDWAVMHLESRRIYAPSLLRLDSHRASRESEAK
jgi:DNA-binding MarR family transcriptional regulator